MKRIICCAMSLCLLLMLFGCSGNTETEPVTEPVLNDSPITMDGPMTAVSLPAVTEPPVTAEDGTVLFTYSYQNMAFTLDGQETANLIILDFLNRVDSTRASADSIAEAAKNAYPTASNWTPYMCRVTYNPTRLDRGILSLFGNTVSYSGSSHPDLSCVSANYNLLTGDPLTLGSILTHVDSVEPLCNLVISKLDAQAEEKHLRSGYQADIRQRFAGEESYDDDFYFSDNGLCFYFAPYEIAPYSSGVIIAEIPYTELTGIIADEFFPGEKQNMTGTIQVAPFTQEDAENYKQISELILDPSGEMYILQTDSCVENIRINVALPAFNDTYTAYAAQYLNPGDGIVVQLNKDHIGNVEIQYESAGQTVTLPID